MYCNLHVLVFFPAMYTIKAAGILVVKICQICNDGIAELLCVYCDIKLCKRCTGFHISDDPEKHKFVKLLDKNMTLVMPICVKHSKERCKNYCQQCDLAVCSSCVPPNLTTDTSF